MKDLNIVCPHGNDCMYVNILKTYSECPRFIDLKNIKKCDESKENLLDGLKNNEFTLLYQPKIDSRTNELVGLEALLRWNHPTKGFLTPDKFLDNIYMHGVMKEVDKFVINRAKKDLQTLKDAGYNHSISVNVSVSNPVDCDLDNLEIEITEVEMVVDREIVSKYLKKIPNKILLDDFGTGFSSLQYLQDFKIDILKIDRAFISKIPKNTIVLEAIIMLARMLNIDLIAEGVETKEQLDWCKAHDVYVIQGYYFDKPEPLDYIIKKYLS